MTDLQRLTTGMVDTNAVMKRQIELSVKLTQIAYYVVDTQRLLATSLPLDLETILELGFCLKGFGLLLSTAVGHAMSGDACEALSRNGLIEQLDAIIDLIFLATGNLASPKRN